MLCAIEANNWKYEEICNNGYCRNGESSTNYSPLFPVETKNNE